MIFKSIRRFIGPKIFSSFIKDTLFYKNLRETRHSPLLITWDITYLCDNECRTCYKKKAYNPMEELSLKERINIIHDMGRLKLPILSIGGGEPLMIKDFGIIVREIKKNNILLNIDTNGRFIKECIDTLLLADMVNVSIDSTNEENFRRIRNYSLKDIEKNLKLLINIRNKKSRKVRINLRMGINALNFKEIYDFYQKWKDLADDIQFQPTHDDRDVYFKKIKGDIDNNLIKSQFERLAKQNSIYNNKYYRNFHLFFNNPNQLKKKFPKCYSFYYFIGMDPFGNVYNCGGFKLKIGNLRKDKLSRILNNKEKIEQIIKLNNECSCYYHCAILNNVLPKWIK